MPFLDEIDIRVDASQQIRVTLNSRLRYIDQKGRLFTVPGGFGPYDLASIPWWLKVLPGVTSWALSAPAGTLHDCLYRFYNIWRIPRAESDLIYQQALIESGVKPWRARIQRAGLRVGGGGAWKTWRRTHPSNKGPKPPPWKQA